MKTYVGKCDKFENLILCLGDPVDFYFENKVGLKYLFIMFFLLQGDSQISQFCFVDVKTFTPANVTIKQPSPPFRSLSFKRFSFYFLSFNFYK
jgi:hypothetical protein